MKDEEAFIQKLNNFYLKKKALKQPDAKVEAAEVKQKTEFNQKEKAAFEQGRAQLEKAEKFAKSAEKAIVGEKKTVKTAQTLVENIKIKGESDKEKQ